MYVITGATARTGGAIARDLLARGLPVRAISRSADKLQRLVDLGAEPYIADPRDVEAMSHAFVGASAAWVMLQPNYIPDSADFRRFQTEMIAALLPALQRGQPGHVVSLSSWGAELTRGNGPVAGLGDLERSLDRLEGSDVLHLRAGYFMENSLAYIETLRASDVIEGPFDPLVAIPWVAMTDIVTIAARHLSEHNFNRREIRELHGERDLNIDMALSIIGTALDRPKIRYRKTDFMATRKHMRELGTSENVADLMIEVAEGINGGIISFNEPRSTENSSPTTFEQFVSETWLPAYGERRRTDSKPAIDAGSYE